jgi:hypothetical protein
VTGPNTRTLEKLICTAAMSRISPCVSAGDREILPIDVALVLYDFPEVSTPSAEY